jgi:hypothetical protein
MLRTVLTTWLVLSIGILFSEGAFAEPQRAPEAGAVENLEVERGSTVVRLDRETALMLSPGGGFQLPGGAGFGLTLCTSRKSGTFLPYFRCWPCRFDRFPSSLNTIVGAVRTGADSLTGGEADASPSRIPRIPSRLDGRAG